MSGPLVRRQQIEQQRKQLPVQADHEIRGLRCPVDRCDGELLVETYHITTQPSILRERVMTYLRPHEYYVHRAEMSGWVEVEYLCDGCGASGTMKANMALAPVVERTERGYKWVIVLGPHPAGGL